MPGNDAARPLTPKQEAFVAEYLKDLNATAAAGRAGYSDPNYGRQLLTVPNVAARIAQAQGQRAERATLDAQTVLEGLLSEARGEGPDTSSSGRIRAWELVGKHIGMWKERVELTGKDGGPIQTANTHAALSPDELEGLDAQALARLYFGGKP